jgi:hypothetical protein
MASPASRHMTFQKWLSKPPSVRRKLLAEPREIERPDDTNKTPTKWTRAKK